MNKEPFRIFHPDFGGAYLAKINAYLPDRPGSLAGLAEIFTKYSINITIFNYDRSVHPNRVILEVTGETRDVLEHARSELHSLQLLSQSVNTQEIPLAVMDTRNILKIEVQLENMPGTLGSLARLLANHEANVIYMHYNEDISETSADISLFTRDSAEVEKLLKEMNAAGYYYSIIYRGAGHKEVEDIIGLSLMERFFFKLQKIMKTDDVDRLRRLIYSSKQLSDALVKFSAEAGKHFEEGSLITNVLAFASASLMKADKGFSYQKMPGLQSGNVTMHAFKLPAGGNIYVLESSGSFLMIDSGYGLYYEDVKKMLSENCIPPDSIRDIYLTHADADHAGLSGYFNMEFGCNVHMHRNTAGVIRNENRAWGSGSQLTELSHFFTVLVNEFTRASFPKEWIAYGDNDVGMEGEFRAVDSFEFGGHSYKILESEGGHVPGQVFFMSYDSGLIFTADYLLNVDSLSAEEREMLNYPKFMMTSTNVNSALFKKEMEMLRHLAGDFDAAMRSAGSQAYVVPGHGDYYPASRMFRR
jgi:glyoxylase-like metal-dependent hydrolase (beta-lactamase superfamily II)